MRNVREVAPFVQQAVEQPKIVQPATASVPAQPSGLRRARPATTIVNSDGHYSGTAKLRDANGNLIPVKRNMDGSIKQ